MEFKFPKGAKLIKDDGSEEPIEGETFELREVTTRDRMSAIRNAETRKTSPALELLRLGFVKFRGKPVTQPFAEIMHFNSKCQQTAQKAYERVNQLADEDDPLEIV